MHSVFLSHSFQNGQDALLHAVRAMIECAGFRVKDGKHLAGPIVLPEVTGKIAACRGVVCLVTPEAAATGWVTAEFHQALGQGQQRILVLWDERVATQNPFQGVALTQFNHQSPESVLGAINTLAGTLGMWRESLGNSLRAVLLPEQVGLEAHRQNAQCLYRCEELNTWEESPWKEARLRPMEGGVQAILPEVPLNHSVQVRVVFGAGQFWTSAFMPQDLRLELSQ